MEWELFVIIMTVIIIAAMLANRAVSLADNRARIEMQKRLQKTRAQPPAQEPGKKTRNQPQPQEIVTDVGPWLPELLEGFGIDPDTIYEDEMPPDLKAFLPMIKGYFMAQGGIPGIMQNLAKGQQAAPQEDQGL